MTPPGSLDAPPLSEAIRLSMADRLLNEENWAAALALLELIDAASPAASAAYAVKLAIAHCRIELASAEALDGLVLAPCPAAGTHTEDVRRVRIQFRAFLFCQTGDFARARRLMRLLGDVDPFIAACYRTRIDAASLAPLVAAGASAALAAGASAAVAAGSGEPAAIAALGVSERQIVAAKQRFAGKRLLVLTRHYTEGAYEVADNLGRSARAFGLDVREMPTPTMPGVADEAYVAALGAQLRDADAPLVLFSEFAFPPDRPDVETAVYDLLRTARRNGAKVMRGDGDAWYTQLIGPDQHYVGLGDYFDLMHHCHPTILPDTPAAFADRVVCWPWPYRMPALDVAAGTVPRGCFVGSAHNAGVARLVWWAESGARGLPIDFSVVVGKRTDQLSDADYAGMLRRYALTVNFTQRPSGIGILTGRAIEAPLCGGLLVEEDSIDTRYFMAPGEHYETFRTLDELAGLTDALLADPARRRRIAAAGQAWASRYYTGDYFWTAILARLWG